MEVQSLMGILAKAGMVAAGLGAAVAGCYLLARWLKPCLHKGHIPRRHPQGHFLCDREGCTSKATSLSEWGLLDNDYLDDKAKFFRRVGAL